jgi:hypothetical protein
LKKSTEIGITITLYIEIGLLVLEGEMRQRYIIEKRVKKEREYKMCVFEATSFESGGRKLPMVFEREREKRRERESPQVLCKTGEPQCCNANKDAGFVCFGFSSTIYALFLSLIQIPTTQLSHYMELQISK